MFRPFTVWTHKNMLDCAILVLKSFRLPDGRRKLKVRWMLRNGSDMGFIERVTVTPEQLKNWYEINPGQQTS